MSRRRILIIDDEQHIVSLLSMTLRKNGYEVLTADNGPKGLKLMELFEVDMLVVDHCMPGMTGADLARVIDGSVPILMVTARPEIDSDNAEHIAAVIHKPFSPREVVAQVEALIGPGRPPKEQSA